MTRSAPKAPADYSGEYLKDVRGAVGVGSAMYLADDSLSFRIRGVVPSGCATIDKAIGRGGVPLGRLTVLHGKQGSGKTTLLLSYLANCQRAGGVGIFIDKEHKLDPDWSTAIGVDNKRLIICQPSTLEEVLEILSHTIATARRIRLKTKTRVPVIAALDSINACISKKRYEKEDEEFVALEARVWSRRLPKLIEQAAKEDVGLIFTSQVRRKIGVMYGDDETLAGGESVPHHASVIAHVKRIGFVTGSDEQKIGSKVVVEFKKNQIAAPYKKAHAHIQFPPHGAGFDWARALLDQGEADGVIQRKVDGKTIRFWLGEVKLGSANNATSKIRKDEELARKLRTAIVGEGA